MVGHPHYKLEWKVPSEEGSGLDYTFRCLPDRMGCHLSEAENRWGGGGSLVSGGEQHAHKLPGVAGSNISSKDIPEECKQEVSTPQVGQYHSSGIHKQPGRDNLQAIG